MKAPIQPAIFGATGYSGFELVRLLARHAGAKKPMLVRRNGESGGYADLSEAYPQLLGNGGFPFESFSWRRMKDAGVDVVFLRHARTSSPANWCRKRSRRVFG